eukprot:CAMPEP_0119296656 /NCGR_PEP_ID=MMETSP1329-20130426/50679_1 /TAXON_ID=114041 /ORGANISM="Genus nov. species nov., Strain RCC1024" /LENGTH=293 /DNA_ID=CAMNT_0007297593 /DNA_START=485 /DNA_END=1362 /DNA_ORIENTATION=-
MARAARRLAAVAALSVTRGLVPTSSVPAPPARRRAGRAAPRYAISADEEGMVCTLERLYGRPSIWGDLNIVEARELYRELLPRVLADPEKPPEPGVRGAAPRAARKRRLAALRHYRAAQHKKPDLEDLKSRATAAAVARRAAKRYVRARSVLAVRLMTNGVDSARSYAKFGTWRVYGETTEELVARYVRARAAAGDSTSDADDIVRDAYEQILEKSCCTNEYLDKMLLKDSPADGGPREQAEAFWRQFPFRPAFLRNQREAVPEGARDDELWHAFLLRCVEPTGELWHAFLLR